MARHQRDDQAGVEAAAEHRAERHVAHQPQPHRLVELVEDDLGPLLGAVARVGVGRRVAPPALDARRAIRHHEAFARLELAHLAKRRHRPRHVTEHQVGRDRLGVELVADEPARQHALELRAEHDHVAGKRVVERLDAESVADQYPAPLGAVPGRDGEHPTQSLCQTGAVLLVQVGEDLGVAAAAQNVAASA